MFILHRMKISSLNIKYYNIHLRKVNENTSTKMYMVRHKVINIPHLSQVKTIMP